MRDALSRAGLIEDQQDERSSFEQRLDEYPSNRLGKPVVWAKWLLRRKLPVNYHQRCCYCGRSDPSVKLSCKSHTKIPQGILKEKGVKAQRRLRTCHLCDSHES